MNEEEKKREQLELLSHVVWPVAFLTTPRRWIAALVYALPVLLTLNALVRFGYALFTPYNDVLPHVFIALASTMAVFALHAFYYAVRPIFGEAGSVEGLRATLPERAALVDEKNALLRAIKDIAFERDVGKLSPEEFEKLDRGYRLRAKEVLRKLDEDLEPYLDRANKMIDEEIEIGPTRTDRAEPTKTKGSTKKKKKKVARRKCGACGTSNAPDAEFCKSCGASVVPIACPKCLAPNEPDAKFCVKCRAPMKGEGEEAKE